MHVPQRSYRDVVPSVHRLLDSEAGVLVGDFSGVDMMLDGAFNGVLVQDMGGILNTVETYIREQ